MDVMQDAFVAAFEQLSDLRDPSLFRPWLHRMTVHLVHRRFRRRRLLNLLGLGRDQGATSLDELCGHDASAEARAELRWLDHKLSQAGDPERIAWMLRHIDGLSIEEVADACGCSLATAKRRIAAVDALVELHFARGERP